jgi:hypothetical protein
VHFLARIGDPLVRLLDRSQLVAVHEQLAVATASTELSEPIAKCGGTRRHDVAVPEGMTVAAVTPEFVELSCDEAAQALVLAWGGCLLGQLTDELFRLVDDG